VSRATFDAPSALQNIAKAFGLTPMELRVLLAIVEVGGIPEVATALGVAETTVKSHLRGVFAKTGAGRQADLVKLVASYASPLIG
jgi:DNA-binding CsgD family transcriptional regulator